MRAFAWAVVTWLWRRACLLRDEKLLVREVECELRYVAEGLWVE